MKSQLNCDPFEDLSNKSANGETKRKDFAFRDVISRRIDNKDG